MSVSFLIVFDISKTLEILSRYWVVIITPILALISVYWSPAPELTFKASIQLLFTTLIAVWVGMTFQPWTIIKALAIASGIGALASILNYYFQIIPAFAQADYIGAEQFYVGIYNQKNVLGRVFDIFALCILILSIRTGKAWIGFPVVLVLLLPLLETKSASSLIVYFAIISLPMFWWVQKNVENMTFFIMSVITFLLVLSFLITSGSIDILDNALAAIGRDSTFTGRTVLWQAGISLIVDNPIFGVGFQAYWQDNLFQEIKSIHMSLPEGVNGFHNAYIEVLVATGIIGFIAYLGIHITAFTQIIRWIKQDKSIEATGALYFLSITILLSQFDVIAFRQHDLFFMLPIILLISASIVLKNNNENKN